MTNRPELDQWLLDQVPTLLEEVDELKDKNERLMKELEFVEAERDEWHDRYRQLEAS